MEVETKPESVQQCSKCGEIKNINRIIKNRNVCKDCCNKKKKENYKKTVVCLENTCSKCNIIKTGTSFIKRGGDICNDCNNLKRREKYNTNKEHRIKLIKMASEFKHNKRVKTKEVEQLELQQLEEEIGQDNTICKYCKNIQPKTRFRYNRLKCKDCERDEPLEKFKRVIRARIHSALKNKNKHTIEYLGCSSSEYIKWILNNTHDYTIENHGPKWHIDHVIPLSKFNLENEEQQLLAFNWRNTMPLSVKENLSKNSKILQPQIKEHLKTLNNYHKENNLEMPQIYIDLFAKYLEAGNPLEP